MAVELVDPRRALEVVSRNLSLPCRDRWLELVVVGALVLTSPSGFFLINAASRNGAFDHSDYRACRSPCFQTAVLPRLSELATYPPRIPMDSADHRTAPPQGARASEDHDSPRAAPPPGKGGARVGYDDNGANGEFMGHTKPGCLLSWRRRPPSMYLVLLTRVRHLSLHEARRDWES